MYYKFARIILMFEPYEHDIARNIINKIEKRGLNVTASQVKHASSNSGKIFIIIWMDMALTYRIKLASKGWLIQPLIAISQHNYRPLDAKEKKAIKFEYNYFKDELEIADEIYRISKAFKKYYYGR